MKSTPTGTKKTKTSPLISRIDYAPDLCNEADISSFEACPVYKNKNSVTWINVEGTTPAILEKIGECFAVHPLILDDIASTNQRPKMQVFDEYLFIVLKMFKRNSKKKEITSEQVSILLGKTFVLSVQEGISGDIFDPIRNRIRSQKGKIHKLGPDYLLYSMIDQIIDNYFLLFEELGEEIEALEDAVIAEPTTETLSKIHLLKKNMILLRKSIWPLREEISGLIREDCAFVQEITKPYLRDVYEHTVQVIDTVETYREMLAGMLDIYLSSINNRLNEVMKALTAITTIFMPLTLITGLYGMNFKHMPELEIWWWYPLVLVTLGTIGILMIMYFKIKKWF